MNPTVLTFASFGSGAAAWALMAYVAKAGTAMSLGIAVAVLLGILFGGLVSSKVAMLVLAAIVAIATAVITTKTAHLNVPVSFLMGAATLAPGLIMQAITRQATGSVTA